MDARVEHIHQQLQRGEANPRVSACEGVGADQHDRARRWDIERITNSHSMTDQNVALEQFHLIGRDDAILERTKSGCDAIRDGAARKQRLHRIRRARDKSRLLRANFHAGRIRSTIRNGIHLIES
jgi:hypothetical protein